MRKSILLATSVAAALAIGLTLQLSAQNPPVQAAPSGTNVAVIDVSFVLENHQRFQAQRAEIKKEITDFEAFLRAEQEKLTEQGKALQQFNPGSPDYQRREEDLVKRRSDLQLQVARKRKELLDREAQTYYNAYKEVGDYVADFARRYRVGLVLNFDSSQVDTKDHKAVLQAIYGTVVYQQDLNITHQILERINRGTPPATARPSGPQIPPRR